MKRRILNPTVNTGAVVLALTNLVCGQEKPASPPVTAASAVQGTQPAPTAVAPQPEPGTLDRFFNGKLPDAVGKSKISVNARLRWEHADQDNRDSADAVTLRTRFGLTSGSLYGFQGMIEGENIAVLGSRDAYDAVGSNPGGAGETVIADPPTTEINQAWVSYGNTNWHTVVKGGRQRLVLDNHRFVGDVGWRQNQQTFDAVTVENKSIPDLSVLYGWVGRVNRVFGNVSGLPAAFRDFESDSHVVNANYQPTPYLKPTGYLYLLDLENAASANNSCATYGLSLTGTAKVHEKVSLDYRAEFAWQTDYADSALDYSAPYYNLELGATIKPFALGVGYEILASDNGTAFRTPLATLHAFNGWADVFLNTPNAGLRDIYAFGQITLPAQVPLRVIYHKFDADTGGGDFGYEVDAVASKKFGKHWTVLAKYSYYDARDPSPPAQAIPADVHKFWLQLEFVF